MSSLNIPLTENPTRQKTWRVVVFVAPIALAVSLIMILSRAWVMADTITAFAPDNTELTVRILNTPNTSAVLEDKFHGTLIFPNAPFTVDQLSSWANRGSVIFINENAVVGLAVAGKVPVEIKTEAANRGFVVSQRFGGTYIGLKQPGSESFSLRVPLALLWPWFNGEVLINEGTTSAPLRLTDKSLTVHGLGRTSVASKPLVDQSLVKISLSAEEAQDLLGFDVPLIFPGLHRLEAEMLSHGFTLALGQDDLGTPYSLAISEGSLSKEDLENVVSELYYTKNLVTVENESSYTSFDELVGSSLAKPVTTNDPSATISSIEDNSGGIVRTAQTSHGLILTNRPVSISESQNPVSPKNTCLTKANQWIGISNLHNLLPGNLSTPGWTISQVLLESQQIAFSNQKTRICW